MLIVTGAAGFIGARLVESLSQAGGAVVSVDDLAAFDSRPEHAGIEFGHRVATGDFLEWLGRDHEPIQAIVHLGACTDTTETNRDYLTRVNLEYSQALWRYCAEAAVPLVYASSAATYGDGSLGYDDDEALIPKLKPLNAYGDSKQQFDVWALAEERRGARPPRWCGLKFFNVYGFGERHKGRMSSVVLQAFDQIRETGRVRLFRSHRDDVKDGHQARDFIYVGDVVEAIGGMTAQPPARGIFNLGSGRARTFLDLARATFAALGMPEAIEFVDTPEAVRGHYQYFTEARMGRLRALGHATAPTSLEDGVRAYVHDLEQGARVGPHRRAADHAAAPRKGHRIEDAQS